MPKVRIRGHRRRKRIESSADWDSIGTLMYLDGMTEEEELDFLWGHPEMVGKNMGLTKTDAERYYIPRIYARKADGKVDLDILTEEQRLYMVDEAMHALRLSRRHGGKFSQDEFDYARILLSASRILNSDMT